MMLLYPPLTCKILYNILMQFPFLSINKKMYFSLQSGVKTLIIELQLMQLYLKLRNRLQNPNNRARRKESQTSNLVSVA